MTTPATKSTTRPPVAVAPSVVQPEPGPADLRPVERLAAECGAISGGLTVDFIDGDHVTLVALGSMHRSGAVAHRLRTLIAAGVRHISIDLRRVDTMPSSTVACLTDVAFHLSDTGGTLELVDVQPQVAAAFASPHDRHSTDRNSIERHATPPNSTGEVPA